MHATVCWLHGSAQHPTHLLMYDPLPLNRSPWTSILSTISMPNAAVKKMSSTWRACRHQEVVLIGAYRFSNQ
jgi:hypothetical protein